MEEFFKREKPPKLDEKTRQAIESGAAVPTIETALSDTEAFPYLLAEVRKLSGSDRQWFLAALNSTEGILDIDDPTRFSEELTEKISKTVGANAAGGIIGLAIIWILTGGAVSVPIAGGAATGLAFQMSRFISSYKKDAKRRDEMHARVVKLKDALLK